MSYVILDLEWNSAYSRQEHRFVNEIIEFGAVKVDDSFCEAGCFAELIARVFVMQREYANKVARGEAS